MKCRCSLTFTLVLVKQYCREHTALNDRYQYIFSLPVSVFNVVDLNLAIGNFVVF
jgi:hypothetical protein